jgi:hypothetical protein
LFALAVPVLSKKKRTKAAIGLRHCPDVLRGNDGWTGVENAWEQKNSKSALCENSVTSDLSPATLKRVDSSSKMKEVATGICSLFILLNTSL